MIRHDAKLRADHRRRGRFKFAVLLRKRDEMHRQRTQLQVAHNTITKFRINVIGTEVFGESEGSSVDNRLMPFGIRADDRRQN
ncbi:MAG: hypothetical protein DMF58_10615 [Acidobacteria bacterium]|nr:MAG: hypothetical protein DMF58_10615 [Acidobacteriota bacterium]